MAALPHIVCFFVTTAGKNGDELGSDEEQIVQVVYLLYDQNNNKVVDVQNYYVKPQPNELTETLLTDDCKAETGLDEELVKQAPPLDHVLEEFDRFLSAKGVHPEHGGRSFYLLTDGQAHLRQCIHHECCKKNIPLPTYFYKFYDIRKEFKKFYKTEPMPSLKTMIDYLALDNNGSVEYGVRQCQEMAKILTRLVNDGHSFGDPEVINERLEGGICSKNEYVSDGLVVRARGLPWQSSDQDIARFFKGLNIAKGGVALCLSPQGRRNGEALIRFESEEHRDLALKRHKHHIGQRYIEVYKASGKDFINVAGGNNSEAQAFLSRGGQTIIRMRGLPFTSTTQQVLEFFTRDPNSSQVLDGEEGILFVHYPDGRSTGDAFVLFATEEESAKALKKHREMMGSRYIELFKSTTAEVQQVLNRSMDPRNPEQPDSQLTPLIAQIPAGIPIIPQSLITSGTRRDCIRLRNLPSAAQVTDILTFLGEFSQFIIYQGVHMVYTATGEASGEAFIQLDSEDAATLTAINRHRCQMIFGNKKRVIEVIQCSGDDMSYVLTNGMPQMSISAMPTAMTAPALPPPSPITLQRPILSPVTPQTIMTTSALTGTFPYMSLAQPLPAAFTPTITALPQRPAYYPPILYWYPSPPVSPPTPQTPAITYYTTTSATNTAAGPYTGPCMIIMRGLPINVTVQDIMNYFQGFPEVGPDTISIQTNLEGRPNGDALISFTSRLEAERAIVEKNRRHLGNRFIELFMA
ncbi:epithelial splicing regulatory protein 1-like isoform X1 [Biomphalaria glabrata]|uniref:Epithelial splicing regulatory protein 1-like isoform X1 n=2 Tax=Biomphalaria glabrata TaxID=6526 RepID=A0A9W3AYR3_BIOGL|nr:epithelial splicing regulatory protein 1-like isoform X1 [Biomphalaria glabrata]XP_055892354.1 epithelial splicing regulatory protein 1-like isoform X1 [Biomphalaria glabrata]XP_055892355.1 epithelial splicing regulatory protein 1-like isoform X1 [Biomphalaria glabrata]XP_055892356.1 epithelial splicing regulatory protein 1-like isoform X1 [Biomphalaria glabrata]